GLAGMGLAGMGLAGMGLAEEAAGQALAPLRWAFLAAEAAALASMAGAAQAEACARTRPPRSG
ncbi:MAG: hypothetical protein KGS44_16375, partial [Alphaproteobacteria bacterium]|nr:hypothetical protein [Alphaproteobacteria bacterium]